MEKIKCLILEDEKPAQGVLENYIDELPNFEVTATHTNPLSAIEVIKNESIDLIFLDINLPKISGLNFLKSLKNPPDVIVTTAYPEYAIEGYELNVVDYLLKPISFERFLEAISKLDSREKVRSAEAEGKSGDGFTFEKADNTVYKIEYDKIRYIESDRDYVNVHTEEKSYLFRRSLKYWETILPGDTYVRVHNSYIVNIAKIDKISGNRIIMGDDVIPIGRSFKDSFWEVIENVN